MLVEKDEFNLVYVAATRAKLSLVCNLDVQQLLQQADQRSAVLQVCYQTEDCIPQTTR